HNLAAVDPDIELPADHVDMGGGIPVRAGVGRVRIAERNVNSGNLLVLQNIADHVPHRDVGADGELAHAIAVLVGVAVLPEFIPQFTILGVGFYQAVVAHRD